MSHRYSIQDNNGGETITSLTSNVSALLKGTQCIFEFSVSTLIWRQTG